MADELGPAVTALQRKLDEQMQSVTDTKRTINMLLKMSGQPALYTDVDSERNGTVRADQFYGKGLATSAAEYLAMRKQACPPDEILRGLESGGFDFDVVGWKPDDRLRPLAISLAKNTGSAGKFHRLKNGTFGLRSWYDPDFLKKASEGADAETKAKKKRRAKSKAQTAAKTVEAQVKPKKGKVANIAESRNARPEMHPQAKSAKPTSSAKTPSRLEADQTAQKEVKAAM